jgi:hypothetical protein
MIAIMPKSWALERMMKMINLDSLTNDGRVRNLTGHERGLAARAKFDLSNLDKSNDIIEVHVSNNIDAITVSFFQGMFAESVKFAGAGFLVKFHFHASTRVMEQVMRGVQRVRTERDSVLG